ncbi:MAG: hypothetical protein INQ03_23365 [Candidatus Heimdallarchaeota archaeon]|nr:hypothetical protein [Candidatus Heimdallarchaeota archaeon]
MLSRNDIIEDMRKALKLIDDIHPDPYRNLGGRMAFHRYAQSIMRSIPDSGLTLVEFGRLLSKLFLKVGDAHTQVFNPKDLDIMNPGGLPFYFDIVEEKLMILATFSKEHTHLIGSNLISVEGVPFEELVIRMKEYVMAENYYSLLSSLGKSGYLFFGKLLKIILPEWQDELLINCSLELITGEMKYFTFQPSFKIQYPMFTMGSKLKLPDTTKADIVYGEINTETYLLLINSMMTYREAYEVWHHLNVHSYDDKASEIYERYKGTKSPELIDEIIPGLPSATEIFRSMVIELKEKGVKNLIIDISRNNGGSSILITILLYFLFGGNNKLEISKNISTIRKFSDYYNKQYPNSIDLKSVYGDGSLELQITDYDFSQMPGFLPDFDSEKENEYNKTIDMMPTFQAEFEKKEYENYVKLDNILVICSSHTYSAGFTLLYYLHECGCKIVGLSPSGQAGNCFGDGLPFTLKNSKISGSISHKWYKMFNSDSRGEVLPLDYAITRNILHKFNFDENTELLYSLELLESVKKNSNF